MSKRKILRFGLPKGSLEKPAIEKIQACLVTHGVIHECGVLAVTLDGIAIQ